MKKQVIVLLSILISISFCTVNVQASTILTQVKPEYIGDYYYEVWTDAGGDAPMTIEDDGSFSCDWNDVYNVSFIKYKMLDKKSTYREIENITVDYDCDYQSEGTANLSIYGTGGSPATARVLEYYIVESWVGKNPAEYAEFLGTITVDGAEYKVYSSKTFLPPSVFGIVPKYIYYSVRTSKRTSGTVSVMEHFKAWEGLGIDLWDVENVGFSVNGFENKGKCNVRNVSISIDDTKTPDKEFIVGDINGDGNRDSIDFGMLRKYLLGFINSFDYEYGIKAADVNGDGNINSIDLGIYKKYLLGIITEFTTRNIKQP